MKNQRARQNVNYDSCPLSLKQTQPYETSRRCLRMVVKDVALISTNSNGYNISKISMGAPVTLNEIAIYVVFVE